MVSEQTILEDFARRSLRDIIEIRDQAREVVYGHTTSISALSQSTTWDKESADIVLRLANQQLARLEAGDVGATDPLALRPTLGHSMRFGGMCVIAP